MKLRFELFSSRVTPYPSIWKLRQIEQPLRDPRLQIWIPTRLCPSPKKLFAADTLNPHFKAQQLVRSCNKKRPEIFSPETNIRRPGGLH